MEILQDNIVGIDHLAIAVPDLDAAVQWVRDTLGFQVTDAKETHGRSSGMKSAVLRLGPITLVLCEGVGDSSQTTRFVQSKGSGVQHVAFRVQNLTQAISKLEASGLAFSTPRLDGDGLSQIFSMRDAATGLMIELIERRGFDGFRDENVHRLFDSLETQDLY